MGGRYLALIWVQPEDEATIRAAFRETSAVRRIGPRARRLADRAFFETLVRLHRSGEGAPYDGLKSAGRDLGPAIPLADQALASGDLAPLVDLLAGRVGRGVADRFEIARRHAAYPPSDVAAGREYVAAYVSFIHYVERLYEAATLPAEGHFPEHENGAAPAEHAH